MLSFAPGAAFFGGADESWPRKADGLLLGRLIVCPKTFIAPDVMTATGKNLLVRMIHPHYNFNVRRALQKFYKVHRSNAGHYKSLTSMLCQS
jgi:hypothetical protein